MKTELLKKYDPIQNGNVKDVYSGEIYKQINSGSYYYNTYNVSTDGAPLTKSGKRAFWPLQITLNNLPPALRFKNVLLVGMLTSVREPNSDLLNLYFLKFTEQVKRLYNDGIEVLNSTAKAETLRFCPLGFVLDSVARPIAQCRKQFNAYFGCSWCYNRGVHIWRKGTKFPLVENSELRTNESHKNDVKMVKERNPSNLKKNDRRFSSVRGVNGSSCLSKIPWLDMVWSFCFDYMHVILIGVETQFFRLVFPNKSNK